LGVIQNESVHPKLESQPSPDENPESQQALKHDPEKRAPGPDPGDHAPLKI
jgi:hypothetical protein